MVTVNSVNYAKALDPSSDNVLAGGTYGGRVRVQQDTYTMASTASGTVIRIAKLPAGAIVLGVTINHAALGSGVTLAIGYGASGAEFQGATLSAAAGQLVSTLLGNYVVGTADGDDVIIVTTGGATGTGAIISQVYYTTD